MAAIELNDQTAKELQDAARSLGVSVDEFVRSRVLGKPTNEPQQGNVDLDAELDALAISAPPLPADFSRADIYPDEA